ncbi:MAG: phage major capsid protein [Anaeroplasma sp.]
MIDQAKIQSLFKPQFINEVFQKMCETSFALKHGTRLPNMTGKTMDMDILSNLPMAYWVGQDTEKRKLTSLALKGKRIYAEELSVIIPISRNSLMDSNVDLEEIIKERLVEAGAVKIDQSIITGVGKPKNFREGLIPSCVNHKATVSRNTFTSLYAACDEAMRLVEESDYEVSAFAGGLGIKSKFRNLVDKNGRPLTDNEISDMPKLFLKNGAWNKNIAELLVGDFKQIYYAMRQEMDVRVLDQATIEDPDTGTVYHLAQQNMVAFMINMRMGWEIPNPISREVYENNPNYFPFAVITPADATLPNTLDFTLTVSNGTSGVANADVTIGGQEFKSNESGVVVAKVQPNQSYVVTVFADGYSAAVQKVDVAEIAIAKTITLQPYDSAVKGSSIKNT